MSKMKELVDIKEKLIELNFNILSKGFKYWVTLIEEYYISHRGKTLEEIYKIICKLDNTTRDRVERNIRTASKQALPTIREYYNYKNKRLSTKDILELIYWEKIKMIRVSMNGLVVPINNENKYITNKIY